MFNKNILSFALLIALTASVGADIITFRDGDTNTYYTNQSADWTQNGYQGTQDNALLNGGSTRAYNFGQNQYMRCGDTDHYTSRFLVMWDISSLNGEGITVSSATISLYSKGVGYPAPASGIDVHAILPANADWNEGSQIAAVAASGDMCWTVWQSTNGQPDGSVEGTPWAGSPGCSTPDVDYDSTPLHHFNVTGNMSSSYAGYAFEIPASLVQEWIDNPSNNAGILVKYTDDAEEGSYVQFLASDNAPGLLTRPQRPALKIGFAGEEPPPIDESDMIVNVTDYGATGNGVTDDTDAIRNAAAALQRNYTLLFPETPNHYKVQDNISVVIDDHATTVDIRGRIKSYGIPTSGDYIFDVFANDVNFTGQGGGAVIEGTNEYMYEIDDPTGACFIRLNGTSGCTIRNLTLRRSPHFTIWMWGATKTEVSGCIFEGGPLLSCEESNSTQIQGILFTGASEMLIRGNIFRPDETGGMAYSWIGSSSTSSSYHIQIIDNQFDGSFDHSVYCSGIQNSVIANNTTFGAVGTAIKVIGKGNIIANNNIYDATHGGIEIRNGSRNMVVNNIVNGFGNTGIEVSTYGGGSGDYRDNIIEGNFLYGYSTSYEGVRLSTTSGNLNGNKVINNLLTNTGRVPGTYPIGIWSSTASYNLVISGNIINGASTAGIDLSRINKSIITDNVINIPSGYNHVNFRNSSLNNYKADNIESSY